MSDNAHPRQYGVLLPHFGEHADRSSLLEGAVLAEKLGFDSVWARDHVVFRPHHHEGTDSTFIDPFIALSGVAAVTEKVTLGTGALIPHRHPIHTALLFASLARLAGSDRIIAGFGLGSFDHEFEIVGMGGWDRREVQPEQVEIFRKLWKGEPVDHDGTHYQFKDAEVHPTPYGGNLPVWYSGTSVASVRRTVEYCDGWIPGRMPRHDYKKRYDRMVRFAEDAGKPVPPAGVIPYTIPGRSVEEASRLFDLQGLIEEASRRYTLPDGGQITELDHLDGAIIAGPPEVIAETVEGYHEAGCNHFVFDLRLRFDAWLESLQIIGEEVLPLLRSSGR
jgi:alkanesulfonate monooxygenase SsuD/methylene tetrahydromethanopterin reductase-like flavin-dependent oxidoreductase (luciferase family)